MIKLRLAARIVLLALIAACSTKSETKRPVIGYAQVSSVATLDEARAGFFKALADSGFVRDSTITVIERKDD